MSTSSDSEITNNESLRDPNKMARLVRSNCMLCLDVSLNADLNQTFAEDALPNDYPVVTIYEFR